MTKAQQSWRKLNSVLNLNFYIGSAAVKEIDEAIMHPPVQEPKKEATKKVSK